MNELRFIRHAETDMAGRFCGQSDPPVNAVGHQQIAHLLPQLRGDRYDAVYTSDLCRAQTTAAALATFFSIPCIPRPALREIHFGLWEGLAWSNIETLDPVYADRWIQEYPQVATPCGETFSDFERRVRVETEWLLNQTMHRHILVVSHAGVMRTVLQCVCLLNEEEAWTCTRKYCSSFCIPHASQDSRNGVPAPFQRITGE